VERVGQGRWMGGSTSVERVVIGEVDSSPFGVTVHCCVALGCGRLGAGQLLSHRLHPHLVGPQCPQGQSLLHR